MVDDVGLAVLFSADQFTVQVSFTFPSISNSIVRAQRDILGDDGGNLLVAFGEIRRGQGEAGGGLHCVFHGVVDGLIIKGSI